MHVNRRRLGLYYPLANSHQFNVHLLTFIISHLLINLKGVRKMEAECIAMVLEWVYPYWLKVIIMVTWMIKWLALSVSYLTYFSAWQTDLQTGKLQ